MSYGDFCLNEVLGREVQLPMLPLFIFELNTYKALKLSRVSGN